MTFNFSTTYFLEIFRGLPGSNAKIYESEWFVNELNHKFEPIELTDAQLCGADHFSPIEFKMVSRNQYKMLNTEVCSLTTNLNALKDLSSDKTLPLFNSQKKHCSDFKVNSMLVEPLQNFGDYLKSGYKVELMGAIDFTYSNGDVSSP